MAISKRNSKVIRVSNKVLTKLKAHRSTGDSWDAVLTKLLEKLDGSPSWTLPSLIFPTKAKALGEAVKFSVQKGKGLEDREHPIKISKVT